MIWLGVGIIVVVGLLVYVVRHTARLQATSEALRAQLQQFKEGGVDRLVSEKLTVLTHHAAQELQSRERLIQQTHGQLLEEQRKATEALVAFQRDVGAIAKQIQSLGELQGKVGELNDLLKPQQLRGELGEVIVRSLIADKLPASQYEEEYTFSDGKKVEFALRLGDRLIPIDSKLQLEDFKRLRDAADERTRQACRAELKRKVKQKIDEVKQYIRPEEGTYNFALMVIPSEAVYYELIAQKEFVQEAGLYEYAKAQHVFLVSPMTFWAYLTVIAQGLRGLEIGRRAEEILAGLQMLAGKVRGFSQDEFRVLGTHLRNAGVQYEEAQRRLREVEEGLSALERLEPPASLSALPAKEMSHD